jgi:hypothetical protein
MLLFYAEAAKILHGDHPKISLIKNHFTNELNGFVSSFTAHLGRLQYLLQLEIRVKVQDVGERQDRKIG